MGSIGEHDGLLRERLIPECDQVVPKSEPWEYLWVARCRVSPTTYEKPLPANQVILHMK